MGQMEAFLKASASAQLYSRTQTLAHCVEQGLQVMLQLSVNAQHLLIILCDNKSMDVRHTCTLGGNSLCVRKTWREMKVYFILYL